MLIIYGIQHNQTKRIYIGKTTNTGRIKNHFADLKRGEHANRELQKDYDAYGDDFSVYLLETVPKGTFEDREAYWMMYFNTSNPMLGYNTNDAKSKKVDISEFPLYVPKFEFEVEQQRRKITREQQQTWRTNRAKGKRKSAEAKSESYKAYAAYRDSKGLRDVDIAKSCKISTSTLSDWKAGRYRPNADKLLKICKAVDANLEDILVE